MKQIWHFYIYLFFKVIIRLIRNKPIFQALINLLKTLYFLFLTKWHKCDLIKMLNASGPNSLYAIYILRTWKVWLLRTSNFPFYGPINKTERKNRLWRNIYLFYVINIYIQVLVETLTCKCCFSTISLQAEIYFGKFEVFKYIFIKYSKFNNLHKLHTK